MFKQTALITWRADADAASRAALEDRLNSVVQADFSYAGAALPASHHAGDLVWHLHFADEAAWRASRAEAALDQIASDPAVAGLDAAAYAVNRFKVPEPGLRDGVYRTLFIGVDASAPAAIQQQFVDELAGMPDYIPEIRNWAMNPTVASRGERPWTHIWEQEFATVEGLVGPYMTSPYHWGFVDRWFDHEMPEQIVADGAIRHSASVLAASVMARYCG